MPLNINTIANLQRVQLIIYMLKESPKTAKQIRDQLGLHDDICREIMRHMLNEKLVYISDYVVEKHTWSRVYSLGDKPSVDKSKYVGSLKAQQISKRAERDKRRFALMTELGTRRVKERKPRERKPRNYVIGKTKKKHEVNNFADLIGAWYGKGKNDETSSETVGLDN